MTRLYVNNLSTTLNGAITDVATSMTLTDVSDFPAVGSGDTAQITITDGTNTEIVTATAIAGSVVTITRGQEGTSGTAFADLSTVELRETALSFTDVLSGDESPQLAGTLDLNSNYVSFGGSSSSTAYNMISVGGIPQLTGAANYKYTFTSSALVMQAGTTWNELKFSNTSDRLIIKTNNSERMQVDDSGVNISNGDLVMNSNDITSVGAIESNSISFDGGTNVLDEYEEGTWTPTIDGSAGTPTITYSNQTATYIRVGDVVSYFARIGISTISGGSGNILIKTLPFSVRANTYSRGNVYLSGPAFPAGISYVEQAPQSSQIYIEIIGIKDNAAPAKLQISGLSAGDTILLSGQYFV